MNSQKLEKKDFDKLVYELTATLKKKEDSGELIYELTAIL